MCVVSVSHPGERDAKDEIDAVADEIGLGPGPGSDPVAETRNDDPAAEHERTGTRLRNVHDEIQRMGDPFELENTIGLNPTGNGPQVLCGVDRFGVTSGVEPRAAACRAVQESTGQGERSGLHDDAEGLRGSVTGDETDPKACETPVLGAPLIVEDNAEPPLRPPSYPDGGARLSAEGCEEHDAKKRPKTWDRSPDRRHAPYAPSRAAALRRRRGSMRTRSRSRRTKWW